MEIHDANGKLVKKITGLPDVVYGGQGGLLDVAFDPNFANNKIMYWSYSEKYQGGNLTAVAKGRLNEASGQLKMYRSYFVPHRLPTAICSMVQGWCLTKMDISL